MGNLVKHLDKIRHTLKTHLCIIHHSGKDLAKGARGHSLLRAAADTELEVANHVIRAKKQRDMEEGIPIAFELITCCYLQIWQRRIFKSKRLYSGRHEM